MFSSLHTSALSGRVMQKELSMGTTKGCARVEYELLDGETVYPTPVKNRATKKIAYRVSDGGKGGNTLARTIEVDEATMIACVRLGMAVRATSADGTRRGQYRKNGRAVVAVRIDGVPV